MVKLDSSLGKLVQFKFVPHQEGLAVGFLYMIVGLVLAFPTHALVHWRSVAAQRGFMFVGMLVAYWAVSKVIYLDNWKTGYSIHAFWPKSWW